MIAFHEVSIGSGGVAPCIMCSGRSVGSPRAASDVAEDLSAFATTAPPGPGPNVIFTGFEPFAHPELPQLVQAAATAGFERIKLRTDGGGLGQAGNAAGVLGAGVRQLEIVVLGDAEIHDELTGRRGLFAAAEYGVAAFRAAAEKSGAHTAVGGLVPVCRHNAMHVARAIAALVAMGVENIVIDASGHSVPEEVLASALDTATVGLAAIAALGAPVPSPYDRRPWTVVGGPL